jgi:hypothetical protein
MSQPRRNWTLADLIDFEVLTARDKAQELSSGSAALEERDRQIARQIQSDAGPAQTPDRPRLFLAWLQQRLAREAPDTEATPGRLTILALTLISLILGLTGFVLGKAVLFIALSGAGLRSSPDEPVNVLFFLVTCVVPQVVFILAALSLLVTHNRLRIQGLPPLVRGLFVLLLRPLFSRFLSRIRQDLPAEVRQHLAATVGLTRSRTITHAGALRWPVIGMIHTFSLGYATAIALGTFLSVQIWHQPFAWQSTVAAYTPERVHRVVQTMARPWSWAIPEGTGHPTLDAVAATRFHRHQDPAELPPEATSSWWVFLTMSTVVYGFLPRLLLLLWTRWKLARALARERFDALDLDALYERLTHAHVEWHPHPANTDQGNAQPQACPAVAPPIQPHHPSPGPATLLIHADLDSPATRDALRRQLESWKGWILDPVIRIDGGTNGVRTALDHLQQLANTEARTRIFTIQEAFMPPTREVLNLLRDLRSVTGRSARILIGLIGKPSAEPLGQPALRDHIEVWKQQVQSLGDPNLDAQPLPRD